MKRRAILTIAAALCLAGCGTGTPPAGQLKDITGMMPNLEFDMTSQTGAKVTAQDFLGAPVLLYFGYTSCPDVCPTTLAIVRAALAELGNAGRNVRVLFVTVDPGRDTTAKLATYLGYFGPEFVGLTGDDGALKQLTKRYRVGYSVGKPDANGNYEVTHSSAVFVFDDKGEARYLVRWGDKPEAIAQALAKLV
jgi:protein SCO1/2